jgi:3'-phosphoadenosine 5'-phosphosulfate sulfotransferase (PAPS reductase)/FAD synthetase
VNIVSVSGGKDSTALYLWAMDQFKSEFKAVFADTGHEHPVTYNYVRNLPTMASGPEITWVKADFTDRLVRNNKKPTGNRYLDCASYHSRFPSRRAQFCTIELKLEPIRDWVETIRGEEEVNMFVGIRSEESKPRSKLPEKEFNEFYDGFIHRPLLKWTKDSVFEFLKSKNIPPNPLYEIGFSRVGCFPCINSSKTELSILPEWAWEKIKEWEQKLGRSFFAAGTVPGIHIPSVDDVKAWSKTTHGGRQGNLFAPESNDVPSCMSTWGICE